MNGPELPPELRDRLRAYLEDVAPPGQVDELEAEIHEQLARRSTRQPAQVMSIAHETVSSRIRIAPEVAAVALVDHGGLSQVVAAHIVGLPEEAPPAEPQGETEPVIEGWDDFWSPPSGASDAEEPAPAAADAPAAREPIVVRPDAGDDDGPPRPPVAPRSPGTFETWTGGAPPRRPGPRGPLIAVAIAVGVVALAAVGLLALGDGDGDRAAVGDPTPASTAVGGAGEPDGTGPGPTVGTDTGGTDGTVPPGGGAITVEDARITAADGGTPRAGGSALLSLTVGGTGNAPATVQWQLERDGEAVFPAAPLVVPADGDVRLTIPPALLADPGAYLVRVSQDGAVLVERDFEVTG